MKIIIVIVIMMIRLFLQACEYLSETRNTNQRLIDSLKQNEVKTQIQKHKQMQIQIQKQMQIQKHKQMQIQKQGRAFK